MNNQYFLLFGSTCCWFQWTIDAQTLTILSFWFNYVSVVGFLYESYVLSMREAHWHQGNIF